MLIPPADPVMSGRIDDEGELDSRRIHQVVLDAKVGIQPGDRVLIGFCSDLGVIANHGRPGARSGPEAIRRQLANFAFHSGPRLLDIGDVHPQDGDLSAAQEELAVEVSTVLEKGGLPVVLGGGHEVAYGTWSGVVRALGPKGAANLCVVNLDAHFDLRSNPVPSSGSPFYQMARSSELNGWRFNYRCLGISNVANTQALFDRASSLGVEWVSDVDLQASVPDGLVASICEDFDHIYLTVDLDVLPSYAMPAVSAPSSLGVPQAVVELLIRSFMDTGKVVAVDFAEFNPSFDTDGRAARVAARLVMSALS
ncbi:MAG: formimidoylglutamase [Acidimicrobiaceae bacterium]|nr:formimidoylglutamase [Acidimicrobiaceae bacterium]